MTRVEFDNWLKKLKVAWETRNPKLASEICAEKVLWFETPFDKPLRTKVEVLKEWQIVSKQENISVQYEILSIEKGVGLAHWSATFTRLPNKEKVEMDGIFKVKLNKEGLCEEFHQWYNYK